MLSGPGQADGWYSRATAIVLGALLTAALFAILFPWFPGGTTPREGERAPFTLTARHELSYESDVLTAQARDDAAAAVPSKLVFEDAIPRRQLAELDQQLMQIDEARAATLSDSERESRIRAATAGALTQRSIETFAAVSDAEFGALADEAQRVLTKLLAESVTAEQVEDIRRSIGSQHSPLL